MAPNPPSGLATLWEVAIDFFSVKDAFQHNGFTREGKSHAIVAKPDLEKAWIAFHAFDFSAFLQGSEFREFFEDESLDGCSLRGGDVRKVFKESLSKLDFHSALSSVR